MEKRRAPKFIQDGDYDFTRVKFDLRYYVHPNVYIKFKYKGEVKTFRKWMKHILKKEIIKLNNVQELDKLMGA